METNDEIIKGLDKMIDEQRASKEPLVFDVPSTHENDRLAAKINSGKLSPLELIDAINKLKL